MTVDEIAGLRLDFPSAFNRSLIEIAHPEGCHLFLWATDEMYRNGDAVRVARAWGFEPCGPTLIWAKPNFGLGTFPRPQHEPILICRRGSPKWGACNIGSVQRWAHPRASHNGGRIHSAKPDGFFDLVEQVSKGPYLELFARRARLGWDYFGAESLETVELSA